MIRDLLGAGEGTLSSIALLIMLAAFAGVLLWTFRGKKDRFREESNLPLDDSDNHAESPHSM
ncbi:cbb3-type cytochrome c oxidase subunit 3 [bacterium]|nr:cbb3-type cytochrome c oxidase subunit 3 [bacterium]